MPAGAGTPRYEKPELWSGKARWPGGFCHARPRPQRGTSPRTTFFFSGQRPSVYNSATFRRWGAGVEVDWRAHPGSESGMCFRTNDDTCRLDVSGLY